MYYVDLTPLINLCNDILSCNRIICYCVIFCTLVNLFVSFRIRSNLKGGFNG